MDSSFLASVFVIFCLTANTFGTDSNSDDPTKKQCRMRYCTDMSATMDIETASENKLKCQCDDWCWRRQDCCLNYLNKTNVNDGTHYFGIPKADIERGQLHQCQHINPNETFYGYSMISKCGTASHQDTDQSWQWQKSMCEQPIRYGNYDDLLLRVPVSSYATGETYRNIYCAACHNNLENIVAWNTSAICYGWYNVSNLTDALHNMYNFNKGDYGPICYLKFEPQPQMKSARCLSVERYNFIRGCPRWYLNSSTSPEDSDRRREIEWLCRVTRGAVDINRTLYENLYCAACHLNETDFRALIQEKHGECSNIYVTDGDMSGPLNFKSFAVLMDFNMFSKSGNRVGVSKRCSDGRIYDTFSEKCRSIVCPKGHRYRNGRCQQ